MLVHWPSRNVQDKEKPTDASLSHDYSYHDREKYQRLVDTEKNIIADGWISDVFGGTVDTKSLRFIRPGAVTGD